MSAPQTTITRLVVTCDDRPGIVSAVSTFLHERGANILESAQHSSDPSEGLFFLRMEFAATPEATADIVGSFGGDEAALRQSGVDDERIVRSRAVAWHCADRVVRHGGSTVVF